MGDGLTPDHCDFCGSAEFDDVYRPYVSLRQVAVAVCRHCGLAFSRYADVPYSRDPRPSGDADWGNIRWAKGFRLDALRPLLTEQVGKGGIRRVLDVGANRGSFVEWMLERDPTLQVTAVEPDERVVTTYKDRPNIDLRVAKLEHTTLEADAYDFAYCCQTLEHADSAAGMIAQHARGPQGRRDPVHRGAQYRGHLLPADCRGILHRQAHHPLQPSPADRLHHLVGL
jgi:hypothetical protein